MIEIIEREKMWIDDLEFLLDEAGTPHISDPLDFKIKAAPDKIQMTVSTINA